MNIGSQACSFKNKITEHEKINGNGDDDGGDYFSQNILQMNYFRKKPNAQGIQPDTYNNCN